MRTAHLAALALVPVLALSGCVTASTTTRTWGEPYEEPQRDWWERHGRVSSVRETVHRQQGDPAAGAAAGAVVGGVLGGLSHGHHHPGGAVVGAIVGAMVGASASSGVAEDRFYEVFVRFDDGAVETFTYRGRLPFRPGEEVVLTPDGLSRARW